MSFKELAISDLVGVDCYRMIPHYLEQKHTFFSHVHIEVKYYATQVNG